MSEQTDSAPLTALEEILRYTRPRSVIYAGDSLTPLLEHWQALETGTTVKALPREAPHQAFPLPQLYDLALVAGTLEHLSGDEGKLLLGQLRNMGAQKMAVLVASDSGWCFRDFIGLGFVRQQDFAPEGNRKATLSLYTYDIANYNHKRTWNTPENWANPEMWDKARW